ncbi:MAG TPA: metal-dependent hydrolase [bacterium]|nr:metal-dependent hydrolase [bacterium]HOL47152.1 metal-dependent hydrolase [bacterium]HPQ18075.1 metal-dependent hydrolase [bacterium]
MADGASHILFGFIINKIFKIERPYSTFILFGSILPDLLHKPVYFLSMKLNDYFMSSHSIFTLIFVCSFFSLFFLKQNYFKGFLFLYSGSISHLFLDIFQFTYQGDIYPILAPFSYKKISIPIIHTQQWLYYFVPLILITIFIVIRFPKYKTQTENWIKKF